MAVVRVAGRNMSPNGTAVTTTFKPTEEKGASGLNAFYGHLSEAYIKTLEWPDAYSTYDEMRRRDPTLRSILNAIKLLARQAEWKAEGATDQGADQEAADFLDSNLVDMSHTVEDFIDDVFTFLPFGWSDFEIVYKRRMGGDGSQFDDGKIGWRKFAFRRQSSFSRWEFDDTGGFNGWWQIPAPDYREIYLPPEKLVHFVAERDGQNPEGMCLFESAYEPYHFVTNLQIINGIGWQRAFVGLPVFELEEQPTSDDLAQIKAVGEGLVVDAKQYVSLPPKVKFHLESTANTGAATLLDTIRAYRIWMTMTVMADFMFLGSSDTGSWALGSDKSELFIMAVNGLLDKIAAIWNKFGVRRLFNYNEFAGVSEIPQITHTQVRKPNLPQLGQFINAIGQYIPLQDEDNAWVRQQAGMPKVEMAPEEQPPEEPTPPKPETGQQAEEVPPDAQASEPFRDSLSWTGYP